MQTAGRLIDRVVKFSAGVQGRIDQTLRRHTFLMHTDRNAPSVVIDRTGTILLQTDIYMIAAARKVLIHRIVYDLIDQMIESLTRSTAYIHTGSHSYSLKAFEHLDTFLIISLGFRHE